ncbi:hypothetical protein CY34DRAFT_766822 [Suillus luteus UH-Slu-Lm8-n1]|uniref:RNase H type-1 domain-containing protein n=1 Tax=Suillus luteus UH-Slu-Lm8-n1 TaxID=930992 RepID=A0A0D0BMP9_9AGAM|nr:hypothetical protein CY34DRAFT_766822 [Suillus luteus UH-Slu-Lm8-n1]
MSFEWIKGHSGQQGNKQADKLAKGANKPIADELDLYVPDDFNLQGAKLSSITQALAYKGIREHIPFTPRRKTTSNLDITRFAIQDMSKQLETDTSIWTGCRNKDLSKKVRQFVYKAMHGVYRIGEYWTNIPTYEHRARCTHCNADNESMEHILIDCPQNVNSIIWSLAKDTWPMKYGAWPQISLGTILGCGNISLTQSRQNNEQLNNAPDDHPNKQLQKGASHLLKILISESAYLIWVTRCEKTIAGTDYAPQTISLP